MTTPAATPARVLLVDDDDALRNTLARVLTRAGHECLSATDGMSAVRILKDAKVDLIVSDIHMPGMTGIELLREVRRVDLDLPVILMTAGASVETAIAAVQYGALRYLTKPFQPEELLGSITQAVSLGKLARAKRQALELLGKDDKLLGDRAGLESGFVRALEELWMAFQPIVSWSNRSVYAYEALVRSRAPLLGNPGALFDAAERLDRLVDLGRAIRGAVAKAMSAPDAPALVFVNLHPRDLLDEALFDAKDPLSSLAGRVVFEITERASLDDIPDAATRVKTLRERGFRVALDDLGAGYAGLTSFAQLLPDMVKLDMSLVRDVDKSPAKQRLIASMAEVCRDLKILLIAEGIETIAERDSVASLGADLLQGYLFAKPGAPFPKVSW